MADEVCRGQKWHYALITLAVLKTTQHTTRVSTVAKMLAQLVSKNTAFPLSQECAQKSF